MRNVWSAFQRMHNRPPSPHEIEMLEDVREKLKLRDDDAVWPIFIVLSRYYELLVDLPTKMTAAAEFGMKSAERAATAQAEAAAITAAAAGARAMTAAVQSNMKGVTRAATLKWSAIAVTAVIGAMTAAVAITHRVAYQAGVNDTSEMIEVGTHASAWAYSAEGRQAYKFAQTGQLARWMNCTQTGFKRVKDRCEIDLNSGVTTDMVGWQLEVESPRKGRRQ